VDDPGFEDLRRLATLVDVGAPLDAGEEGGGGREREDVPQGEARRDGDESERDEGESPGSCLPLVPFTLAIPSALLPPWRLALVTLGLVAVRVAKAGAKPTGSQA
jgi:hypothetical protein